MANQGRTASNPHHAPASGLEMKKGSCGQYSTKDNPRMCDGHRDERNIPNHQEADHARRLSRDMGSSKRGHQLGKGSRGY